MAALSDADMVASMGEKMVALMVEMMGVDTVALMAVSLAV